MSARWALLLACMVACGDKSGARATVRDDGLVGCRKIKAESQCTVRGSLTPFVIRELRKNDILSRSTLVLDPSAAAPDSMSHLPELGDAVTVLEISTGENAPVDLSALEGLPSLKRLRIKLGDRYSFHSRGGLEVLSRLTGLVELEISNARLSSLRFLAPLAGLEKLSLWRGTIESLDDIGEHPSLRELDLSAVGESAPLASLAALSGLESLTLRTDAAACDLAWLPRLERLTSLSVNAFRCAGPTDPSVFARIPKLEKLRLQGVKLPTIAPLAEAAALTSLMLESTGDLKEIEALARAPKLRSLYVLGLSDFSRVEPLTQLERLEIYSATMPEKTESLGKLTRLKELGLYIFAKQSVGSLPFIESLPELKRISIQGDYLNRGGRDALKRRFPALEQVETLPD